MLGEVIAQMRQAGQHVEQAGRLIAQAIDHTLAPVGRHGQPGKLNPGSFLRST
ncbi:hypothetical protein [Plantactinospora sonchi]|uniref:Uncharacterized protein n=1 Tax=Plantactinospora sonchi TaxID=1544735 RepID=A0ABU7RYK7_9ACTN